MNGQYVEKLVVHNNIVCFVSYICVKIIKMKIKLISLKKDYSPAALMEASAKV